MVYLNICRGAGSADFVLFEVCHLGPFGPRKPMKMRPGQSGQDHLANSFVFSTA
jgi:hypothetical protein